MAKKSNNAQQPALPPKLREDVAASFISNWLIKMPELDKTLKKAGVKRQNLMDLMESDDELAQCVETRVDALLSVPYRLNPSEGAEADFLIEQLNQHIQTIMRTAINARFVGYSVLRAVWAERPDGMRAITKIIEENLEQFEPSINGDLYEIPTNGSPAFKVDSAAHCFLTINNPTRRRPHGTALLAKAYWSVYYRTNVWKFWGKDLERFGSPILVGKTTGSTQEMVDALLAAHGSAVVGIDAEDSIDALATNSNGGRSFEAIETAIIRRINKLILGQTLTSGTDGGSGSRALGNVHNEVRNDKRNSDIRLVLPTVQRVVNALCYYNGFGYHEVLLADGKGLEVERANRDKALYEQGVRLTRKYYEDEYNLEAEYFELVDDTKPSPQFNAMPKQAFSFKADAQKITPQQQEIDNLAPDSYALLDSDKIKDLVLASDSIDDLQSKLFELLPDAPIDQFNEILAQALFTADVLGFKHSSEGS